MVDHLCRIDFFFTEDPVFRSKDHVCLTKGFNILRIAPVEFLHLLLVNILVTICTRLYITKLPGGNRVTNPEHELAVLVVCDLGGIHPKAADRYRTVTGTKCISWILITGTHMERSLGNVYHARRFGQHVFISRGNAMHLSV